MKTCLHCDREARIVAKGLCSPCYKNYAVASLYPNLRWGARVSQRGRKYKEGLGTASDAVAAEPTEAPPGSVAKVEVMRARVERGERPQRAGDAADSDKKAGWVAGTR